MKNIVELRLDGSENYRTLCVSTDTFTPAQLVSLLREEQFFKQSEVVEWNNAWQEDALYFYVSGGLSGVFIRQRTVKTYHLVPGYKPSNEVMTLD